LTCLYELRFPSGRSYIGVADNFESRWAQHVYHASRGTRLFPVYCALRKYGADNVVRRVLAEGPRDYILDLERRAIAAFGTRSPGGYNVSYGGETATSASPEAREKIRASKLAHWMNPDYRAARVAAASGRLMTAEQNRRNAQAKLRNWADADYRAKVIAAHTGKKQSAETLAKRAESLRAAWASGKGREARAKAMSGRLWANNGSEHRQLREGEQIPAGWQRGMLKRKG
jgi:hypothetical protein